MLSQPRILQVTSMPMGIPRHAPSRLATGTIHLLATTDDDQEINP
jgi:hypothetical protein